MVLRAAATAAASRSCSARRLSAMRWARAIESRRAASRLSVFGPDDCAGAAAGVGAGVGLLPPQAAATPAAVRITLKGTTRDKRVIALLSRERKKGTNMFQSPHGDG